MLKTITGVSILMVGCALVLFIYEPRPTEYQQLYSETTFDAPQTVEKVVEVDALDNRIKSAQETARAQVEQKAKEAYDRTVNAENLEIARQVTKQYREEIEAREAKLEEQASF